LSADLANTPVVHRLTATGLKKRYGSRYVVEDVHLSVDAGEVVGLLGPNGAGKTTSFYMIVGLVRADAGQIDIDGQRVERLPIHQRSRLGLSYLPQEASIFRQLNVEDNIRAVLELQVDDKGKRLSKPVIDERLNKLLHDLSIEKLRTSPPWPCRAASAVASRSRVLWPRNRALSCWTSPLRASIRSP